MIVHQLPDKQCTLRTNPNQEFCYRYDSTGNLIIYIVQVTYQTPERVFHRDIQTLRRELKIRHAAEYFT